VAALSDRDVWVVGDGAGTSNTSIFIEHFDGRSWHKYSVSGLPPGSATLQDVKAVSTDDVWAVGSAGDGTALALHWNGKSWKRIVTPESHPGWSTVWNALLVKASNDVWVVGGWDAGGPTGGYNYVAMAAHWDGHKWVDRSPSISTNLTGFSGVAALAGQQLLTVGNNSGDSCCFGSSSGRWTGSTWVQPTLPDAYASANGMTGVSPTEAWAVGDDYLDGYASPTWHWQNGAWHLVRTHSTAILSAVTHRSASDIWAVGGAIERYDGKTWRIVQKLPRAFAGGTDLTAITVSPSGRLWAVGRLGTPAGDWRPLVMLAN
jgi:hypothetical protein